MPRGVPLAGAKMPMRGLAPNCGRQECRPSYGRCFLTWRIDYFRALALLLANTRKSETSDFQTLTSKAPPQGRLKMGFSPLYGTFRPHFSLENWPWIEISIPWIGESMGWKSISMGCFGRNTPRGRISKAKRRTTVGVRFNGLTYSAQGFGADCGMATKKAFPPGAVPGKARCRAETLGGRGRRGAPLGHLRRKGSSRTYTLMRFTAPGVPCSLRGSRRMPVSSRVAPRSMTRAWGKAARPVLQ